VSLSGEIFNAAGQPLTARVGIVVSSSPLQINVQGTIFEGASLGLIGSAPSVDDVVLLLGQSVKGAKTSGSSWIVMGTINPAP
jgi:hypothetical protein